MTVALHEKYDLRLPRYTSYPTAPHFTPAVTGETFSGWLAELDPSQPVSLYIHVPFCEELCYFCGCNTKITKQVKPIEAFVETLHRELDLAVTALPTRMKVSHLHFGGGSPTVLPDQALVDLVARLKRDFDFLPDAELALEMDPRTTRMSFLNAMAEAGITRASLGVQDFDARVQKAVNRVQPYEVVKRVVDGLRELGVNGINLDLMYGLPHQTRDTVADTVDRAAELRADRLSVFGYAHVPWMKKHMRLMPEEALPNSEERWAQYETIQDRLGKHDYVAIGLDHFAHADDSMTQALSSGALNRNFQGYTTDAASALIGFGPSAISGLPQGYAQNDPAVRNWRGTIESGHLATEKGRAISADDILRREVINRLMCDMQVDLATLTEDWAGRFATEVSRLEEMSSDGVCTLEAGLVRVTEDGRALVRLVASVFDTYLASGKARHSKAV